MTRIAILPCFILPACFIIAALLGGIPCVSFAAPSTNNPSSGLNDSLLSGDLDDLLKDLPPLTPRESAPPAGGEDLGEDLGEEQSKPLEAIAAGMAKSKSLINKGQIAATPQKKVIADLDELIRQAEKQCQACQNPSPSNSNSQARQQSKRSQPKPKPSEQAGKKQSAKPGDQRQSQQAAQQSTARLGSAAAQSADGDNTTDHMKEIWGRLPQRLREQMLESSSDEFLPQYREEIERYYRRLAEDPQQ